MTRNHAGGVCLPSKGCGSYGAGLARFLADHGETVFECERPSRGERPGGKNDLIDATLAARRIVSGEGLSVPRGGGQREQLRVLLLERRGANRARTAALNQLDAVTVTARDDLRCRLSTVPRTHLVGTVARLRRRPHGTTDALRRIARRIQLLTAELDEIDGESSAGLVSALLPSRWPSAVSLDACSGKQQRHRLNRGGDRQPNWALHVIAPRRVPAPRRDATTSAYSPTG